VGDLSPSIRRALVIGGTGLLGAAVARGLHEAGVQVRVMSRRASRARAELPEPIELVEGDALDPEDVERGLSGCDAVHLSVDHDREDDCVTRVLEATRSHPVDRITYVSGTTVCEENRWFPLVDRKLRSEQAIEASGIGFTIFRPGWLMEMLQRFVRDGRILVFGTPVRRWHFVAVQDFSRMVVESYRHPEAVGRRFYVHGPEAMTVREALESYRRVQHPEIEALQRVPFWLLRLVARIQGNELMQRGVEMVAYLERVGERGDPAEADALLGAPQTTLDRWLRWQVQ
jgi:uncharacterized protein YbjT (DUF2867 family)